MTGAALDDWAPRLAEVAASVGLGPVTVLPTVDSTQAAARRLDAEAGAVITAGRQTAGRGRLGRQWSDGAGAGLAVTIVLGASDPERIAIAAAVAVARAVEPWIGRRVGIKWPNDVVVDGRKLAGILIEREHGGTADGRLLLGIGINVGPAAWPAELDGRAVSLHELGADIERLDVLCALLPAVAEATRLAANAIVAEFGRRDALVGTTATFAVGAREWTGTVECIDPTRGLSLRVAGESVWLPAATTRTVRA